MGHMGTYKTYNLLKDDYHIPNMYREVKRNVKACDLCQKSKIYNKTTRGPTLSQIPDEQRQVISLD